MGLVHAAPLQQVQSLLHPLGWAAPQKPGPLLGLLMEHLRPLSAIGETLG